MQRFEVGTTYDYICDMYKAVKRTKCFVTFEATKQSPFGGVRQVTKRLKIYEVPEYEVVFPDGPNMFDLKATDTFPALAKSL